jgi:hypothetical protein
MRYLSHQVLLIALARHILEIALFELLIDPFLNRRD